MRTQSNEPQEPTVEEKIKAIETDIISLRSIIVELSSRQKEDNTLLHEQLDLIRNNLHTINEAILKTSKMASFLEKRVDGVRTDTSTGIALSILVFAVLFLISLFIR